jgi:DNA (cytosine-5)-methyltransferase 1
MANPKVVDLFAGAGGFSLGAVRAEFNLVASVEIDPHANETHRRNFPNARHIGEDVAALTGQRLLELAGLRRGELTGLIGGPPCQGFSTIGRRNPHDLRNTLFGHFMRLLAETEPAFFVAENVPGILGERNRVVVDTALALVPKRYIVLHPTVVCASQHGVATSRTRVFFAGYDPAKMREFDESVFAAPEDRESVTVAEALAGLHVDVCNTWQTERDYWRETREAGHSQFDARIRGLIPDGVGEEFALDAFAEDYVSGYLGTTHTDDVVARFDRLCPGGVDRVSRAIRLDPDGFCPTLRAGTGSDRGSFQAVRPIHPTRPRVITPREAARLQGFPDWFVLPPTKWHSFRQIGNSVSPIMAEDVLTAIGARVR